MVSIKLGEAFIDIRASLDRLDQDLRRAGNRITTGLNRISARMTRVGRGLAIGLTAPLVAGAVQASRTQLAFDDAMLKIQTLVGVAADEVAVFRKEVLKLSGETARKPAELAEALFPITSAGRRGAEAMSILKASAQAAAAGLGDVTLVSTAINKILELYKGKIDSAEEATGIFIATLKAADAPPQALGAGLARILPFAGALNADLRNVAGTLAFLTRQTATAEEAVTAMRGILNKILKPPQEAQKKMEALGLSLSELQRIVQTEGVVPAIRKLADVFGEGTPEFLRFFEDVQAATGALSLLNANANDLDEVLTDLADSGVRDLSEAVKILEQNAGFRLRQQLVSLNVTLTQIGATTLPILISVLRQVASISRDVFSAFNRLSPLGKRIATGVVAAVALAGPAFLVLGLALKGVAVAIRSVLVLTTLLARRLVLTVGAALVASQILKQIAEGARTFDEIIQGIEKDLGALAERFVELAGISLEKLFGAGPQNDLKTFDDLVKEVKESLRNLGSTGGNTINTFGKIGGALKDSLADAQFELKILRGGFGDLDEDALRAAREAGVLGDAIKKIGQGKDAILVVDGALIKLSDTMKQVKQEQKNVTTEVSTGTRLVERLGFAFTSAFEQALQGGQAVSDILRGLLTDIRNLVIRLLIIEPLFEFIKKKLQEWGVIACESTKKTNKCVEASQGVFKRFWEWLGDVLDEIGTVIDDLFKGIGRSISNLVRSTSSGGGGGFLGGIFGSLLSGVFGGGGGLSFGSGFGPGGPGTAGGSAIFDAPLFQHGGPILKGQPAVVGEVGPELFVPRTSGMIVPNDALGGQSVTVHQNIHIAGIEGMIRQVVVEQMSKARDQIIATVRDEARSGSKFRDAFG